MIQIKVAHGWIMILVILMMELQFGHGLAQDQESRVSRSVRLPLRVINAVPYLQLQLLCDAQMQITKTGDEVMEWPQENQSQFEQLTSFHKSPRALVLLDTGSNQFWLGDNSCSNCQATQSLCPHLPSPERKITYVKGYIEGVDSYINLCDNRVRFLCVKNVGGMDGIAGDGILGLRGRSVGMGMLYGVLKSKGRNRDKIQGNYINRVEASNGGYKQKQKRRQWLLQRNQIIFQFGQFRSYVEIVNSRMIKYRVSDDKVEDQTSHQIMSTSTWSFQATSLQVLHQKLAFPTPITVHIDTGSSKIVFSNNLCVRMLAQMRQKQGLWCRYEANQGIDCNGVVRSLGLGLLFGHWGGDTLVEIGDQDVIDKGSNRIQILCEGDHEAGSVILGYPFLRAFKTSFITEITKRRQGDQKEDIVDEGTVHKIRLERRPEQGKNEKIIYRVVVIGYIIVVGCLGWATVMIADLVRNKRSTKIII